MIGIAACFLLTIAAGCAPIEGSAPILEDPAIDYVIVGELHGTDQIPSIFGDLVCLAGEQRPVMVALEIPRDEQGLLDAYLASSGDTAARDALLTGMFWQSGDGRSSAAMLALVERLRVLFQAKRILGVAAVVDSSAFDPKDGSRYEAAMARGWVGALAAHPGAQLLALVGNAHAIATRIESGGRGYEPAASFLPRAHTVTLGNADAGGAAYICLGPNDCGPHETGPGRQNWPRSIRKSPQTPGPLPWDYLFAAGTPFTASAPARPTP